MLMFLLVMFGSLGCALLVQLWVRHQLKLLRAKETILVRSFCLLDLDMRMESFYWRHCGIPMDPGTVRWFIERLTIMSNDPVAGSWCGADGYRLVTAVVHAVDRNHPSRFLFEQLAQCLGVFFSCSNVRQHITIKDIATKLRDIHGHSCRLAQDVKNA